MKNTKFLGKKILLLVAVLIIIVMLIPTSAFANDDDGIEKDEIPSAGSLEGFWMRYSPEDIGYHVVEPMEKICILGDEGSLEIQIIKDENDGSLLEHFLGVTVSNVYTSFEDLNKVFVELSDTPSYEISEEKGILNFTFSKDTLKCPYDIRSYEFLFSFDDGKAYSLVWIAKESDLLGYVDGGHVWIVKEPPELNWNEFPVEGAPEVNTITAEDEQAQLIEKETDQVQVMENETDKIDTEIRRIAVPLILISVILFALSVFMIRIRNKKGN